MTRGLPILILAGLVASLPACTIVREGECNCDGGGGGGGGDPRVVDMLVLADLQLGTVNLAAQYGGFVDGLAYALGAQNVQVRRAALAPLHQRAGEGVPLLYGTGDSGGAFFGFGDAIAHWAADPVDVLSAADGPEASNLADLGASLGTLTLYRPQTEPPLDEPYFAEPADGLVVVYLSGTARRCGHDEVDCLVSGATAADYVTRTDDAGAAWLRLPGSASLPPDRIFHLAIVSAEGVDFEAMSRACLAIPGFPAGAIDVLQPGGDVYYGPYVSELAGRGGKGAVIDVCTVLSQQASAVQLLTVSRQIAGML